MAELWPRLSRFKILGRSLARISRNRSMALRTVAGLFRSVQVFRRPFYIDWLYLTRSFPPNRVLTTRSGLTIHLSGDEDDLVTIFIVLARRDYGKLPLGTIVDIGAHLGSFTLYAAEQGAQRIYAFEPDPDLFQTLERNVTANGLGQRIRIFNKAVAGQAKDSVTFRREGNASGRVVQSGAGVDTVGVSCITLDGIFRENGLDFVDLLKMDCEGCEYDIMKHTSAETWGRIGAIRMEYHRGGAEEIKTFFGDRGFRTIMEHKLEDKVGLLWFQRDK